MSSTALWSYNKPCTFWKSLGFDEYGDPLGYEPPIIIMCDYIGGMSAKLGQMGKEVVVKNTFFTAFALAEEGDYILIGTSAELDPLNTKADEIRASTRWNDTLDGLEDDWAIITGV
ncbi:hypothetical protein ACBE38_000893 [Klebsiella michiganensis]|uniref:hypothetical protein n=1 Tax=Klebsiella pneumoniae complex TaxID=3390273 RepID=UPI00049F79B9|nr:MULTISPECIES: hypothetical protein [Klebsiella]ELC0836178.1 hypothetical protein [Klebsiella michiganensis]ELF4769066.1 hypothetical protein [Klebsiella michiganensis]KDL74170.1 hypothetical protein AD96_00333 [Klebsiella pneumoniae MGH 70]MCL9619761.1 hypothetical protein [Klebsiella variicola]